MTLNQAIANFISRAFAESPHKLLDLAFVADIFRVSKGRVQAAIALDSSLVERVKIDRNNLISLRK